METPPSYQDAVTSTVKKQPHEQTAEVTDQPSSYQMTSVVEAIPNTSQPIYIKSAPFVNFGDVPRLVTCTKCGITDVTEIERESGTCTWLTCSLLCLLGCPFGCCLIPFCLDSFADTYHFCPNCHALLGVNNRL